MPAEQLSRATSLVLEVGIAAAVMRENMAKRTARIEKIILKAFD